jgi:hypothetical protein
MLVTVLCLRAHTAGACTDAAPCVDAEPLWHSPSAGAFVLVSDPTSPRRGQLGGSATLGFRLKPAVLIAPAPNAAGREINLISHATDLSLGARLGIGRGMEVTLALPAGLYQRGAGIKGVTHQSAPEIPAQSLHDPRLGFGFAASNGRRGGIKLRLELKLPFGDEEALMGEPGPVLSPTYLMHWRSGSWSFGGEAGVRLRNPSNFFGRRIGTQMGGSLGGGYSFARPRLTFTLEGYALGSLASQENAPDVACEWLASTHFAPRAISGLSLGLAVGTNIPLPLGSEASAGLGAPLVRVLAFTRWAPATD